MKLIMLKDLFLQNNQWKKYNFIDRSNKLNKENSDVYSELGITKVISGLGYKTVLGGSILLPSAMKAIEESNKYLFKKSKHL